MPRVKVQKKQTASDLPSTNGNDASSSSTATATEAAVSDVADGIVKQAPKSKVRGKKAVAAAAAAGELNGATEVEEAAVVASVKKPVARGKKKLAEAEDEINVATNGNEASSTPPKSKERGKKTAAEDAAESAPVVAKKSASRGKRKADQVEQDEEPEHTEPAPVKAKGRAKKATTKAAEVATTSKQFDEVEEEPEPAKPKGRAKKATTETVEVATTSKSKMAKKEKATVTKGRAKKEKPDEVKTRTNIAKVQDNETESETEPVAETELVAEPAPKAKAQGRKKKEPEQSEDTEAPREKGRAKKGETVVKKTARANKRHLADAEIAEVLEEDAQDEQPELVEPTTTEPKAKAKPAAKKRGKQAKPNDENVEVPPPKKRGKKTDTENDEVATAPAKKRTAKQVRDEAAPAESKPARGRKRPAGGTADEGVDTLAEAEAEEEADGSRMTKTSKAEPKAATDSYDKSLFPPPADKPFNLKISSWNVAGLRAWLKKNGLGFVEAEEPDIFCLQETKCANDQLPEEMARLPGYHPYWLCMPGGYAGVAIYSKIMPINVEYGIGNKDYDDVGRMITAEYEKFYLINVYVPNSGRKLVNLEMRMRWEQLFQAYVQKHDALKPVVIVGDMNVSHLEIDLANPKSNTRNAGFTKEERDKMTELLALGYVDTFRHLYPKQTGAYTFWTYMANARSRNVGWRLDYCIVSQRFLPRVVDNVMRSHCGGSDHCPITVFLNV